MSTTHGSGSLKSGIMGGKIFLLGMICLATGLAGCATSAKQEIVAKVAKPVLGIAIEDAETAGKLIDMELAAGRITEAMAAELRMCPLAVGELAALQQSLEAEEPEGRKALIYHAVQARLATMQKAQFQAIASRVMSACTALVLPLAGETFVGGAVLQ